MVEKLVRDRIKDFSEYAKDNRVFRIASEAEMPSLLANKILEEAHEVVEELLSEHPDMDKLAEELGDCLEVILAIEDHFKMKPIFIANKRGDKWEKKGGFKNRVVLDLSTDVEKGHYGKP